jgi:hypothetical protein
MWDSRTLSRITLLCHACFRTRPEAKPAGAMTRKTIWFISIWAAILALALAWWWIPVMKHRHARTVWKTQTLSRLASLSITNEEIRQELETLKAGPSPNRVCSWAHDHVLLMTNGANLIYASWHGFNNGLVNHLFLAHSSDGRWLYSTYHFCNDMVAVMSDEPPGSIAEFEKRYSAREFDGKSDECLKKTWPLKK